MYEYLKNYVKVANTMFDTYRNGWLLVRRNEDRTRLKNKYLSDIMRTTESISDNSHTAKNAMLAGRIGLGLGLAGSGLLGYKLYNDRGTDDV